MRKKEFVLYLSKNGTPSQVKDYPSHCKAVEMSFGGMDLDDIIVDYKKISRVKDKLLAQGYPSGYMSGFNAYLQFAFGGKSSVVTSIVKSHSVPKSLVVYENSVPIHKQDSGLCEFLESEYVKIRKFAKNILGNIQMDFDVIPVYLSPKKPTRTYYKDPEFLLGKMKKHCSECKREDCTPPYCYVSEVLWNYKPFSHKIGGEFYDDPEPHIVLYYNNFDNPSVNNKQFLAAIAKTLAHEYLHYLHYAYAKEKFSEAKEGLKEALADFFGVLYSVNLGGKYDLKVAEDRYKLWKKHEGFGWPYAYALHFLSEPYKVNLSDYDSYEMKKAIEKLREVFRLTPNAKDAYLKLIN